MPKLVSSFQRVKISLPVFNLADNTNYTNTTYKDIYEKDPNVYVLKTNGVRLFITNLTVNIWKNKSATYKNKMTPSAMCLENFKGIITF